MLILEVVKINIKFRLNFHFINSVSKQTLN